jgi:hypothetical protein
MSQEVQTPTLTDILTFADKLDQFRGTLGEQEQQLLKGLILAACGDDADLEAFVLPRRVMKRTAVLAAAALGLASGHLGGLRARAAYATDGRV